MYDIECEWERVCIGEISIMCSKIVIVLAPTIYFHRYLLKCDPCKVICPVASVNSLIDTSEADPSSLLNR